MSRRHPRYQKEKQAVKREESSSKSTTPRSWCSSKILLISGLGIVSALLALIWVAMRRETEILFFGDSAHFEYSSSPTDFNMSYPIGAASADLMELQVSEYDMFQNTIRLFKDLVFEQTFCLYGYGVLNWLWTNERNLMIAVRPPHLMDRDTPSRINAYYHGGDNDAAKSIIMRGEPDFFKRGNTLRRVLRNEFFHVITHQANVHKNNTLPNRDLPFLNQKGGIDSALNQEYIDAVDKFYEKLNYLNQLINKPKEQLTSRERALLQEAEQVFASYQPAENHVASNKSEYKSIKRNGNRIHVPITDPTRGPPTMEMVDVEAVARGNTVDLFFRSTGQSKLEIFLKDQFFALVRFDKGGYSKRRNQGQNYLYTEMGSDIESLDPKIRQFIAPEFCRYMGRYIGIDEQQYCAIPTYPQCGPRP